MAALCGTGIAGCGPGPWPARVRLIVAATVLGCAGYGVPLIVLPVSPPGPDPRVRWLESHCTRQPQPPHRRLVPYATFSCGPGTGPEPSASPPSTISGTPSPAPP